MIEDQLRAELAEHMRGAAPTVDWVTPAERSTERRRRRQVAGTAGTTFAVVALIVGAVTLPHRDTRTELKPAAPTTAASPSPSLTDYVAAIASPDGAWTLGFRVTTTPSALCLDLTRANVAAPINACAPNSADETSYHQAAVTVKGKPRIVEFGLVPAGTTSVRLTGNGFVGDLTPIRIQDAQPLAWFAEGDRQSASASALLSDGTTIDLLSAQKKTCPDDPTEIPDIAPCPAATPPTTPTTSVQSAYAHDEGFCSAQGELHYVVRNGTATLTSSLAGLPRDSLLGFNWINDAVRGYNVAAERTTDTGTFDASTLNMFRGGEVRGIAMQVTNGDNVILRLNACQG